MTPSEQAILILAEECAEVVQVCSKILRFGPMPHNIKNLTKEVGDIQQMIQILYDTNVLDPAQVAIAAEEKKQKLKLYSDIFNNDQTI